MKQLDFWCIWKIQKSADYEQHHYYTMILGSDITFVFFSYDTQLPCPDHRALMSRKEVFTEFP